MHRDRTGRRSRIQLDLTKGGFILHDVLAQHVPERLGLLRAQVNSLEVLYLHQILRGLRHGAERQQKIPHADANLDAIGVPVAIIGGG